MDATIIRRYLQPSPTLRWHPWAPLFFGALLLAFVFYLGARWGFSAGNRIVGEVMVRSPASDVFFRTEQSKAGPARAMANDAQKLDRVVHAFIVEQRNPPGVLDQWSARAESMMFLQGHSVTGLPRDYVVKLAELRLSEYSGASPRWQVTSTLCDETPPFIRYGNEVSVVEGYRGIAADYSQLLGRTVRPEDLAPAVPGGKCIR